MTRKYDTNIILDILPATQNEIVDKTNLNKGTVRYLLKILVDKGHVKKEINFKDLRTFIYVLN